YRDAISAVQRFIYMENPYLISAAVGEALANRLREADGPEIILVISRKSGGWLEEATMDVLRSRLLRWLRDADRFKSDLLDRRELHEVEAGRRLEGIGALEPRHDEGGGVRQVPAKVRGDGEAAAEVAEAERVVRVEEQSDRRHAPSPPRGRVAASLGSERPDGGQRAAPVRAHGP